eukprot:sb/3465950/
MKTDELESTSRKALRRLFQAERSAENTSPQDVAIRHKLIVGLVTQFGKEFRRAFIAFVLEDMRARADIIIAWLYSSFPKTWAAITSLFTKFTQIAHNLSCCFNITTLLREYTIEQGYVWKGLTPENYGYDNCLQYILHGVFKKLEPGDRILSKVLLDCPEITEGALTMIKSFCENPEWLEVSVSTVHELLLKRANLRTQNTAVRELAITKCKDLFAVPSLSTPLEDFATTILTRLIAENPVHACSAEDTDLPAGPYDKDAEWSDESIKSCLHLFLALLPLKPRMVHGLAEVYRESSSAIKRTILRMVEAPVSQIGMKCKEILQLIENGPKGSETLVTRILHILTESELPTKELVVMVIRWLLR